MTYSNYRSFSQTEVSMFKNVLGAYDVTDVSELTPDKASEIFTALSTSRPPELNLTFTIWLLHQNLPQSAREYILDSDFDHDGITLRDEFANGTNPFEYNPSKQKQDAPSTQSNLDSSSSGASSNRKRSAPQLEM